MTSTIKVNTVTTESGSTLTLGESGKTIALASGASQTGFGATGGISWQTSIKTSDFTAVSGEGYFVNTSGGSNITVTLPASPSAGNVVAIKDYARTFGTNKVILDRNGSNMDGSAANTNLETDGESVILVFMDSTKGWSFINEDITTSTGATFVTATGGTISTAPCGNFKVHTFTGPGTFCVSCAGNASGSNSIEYLVVAGGGAGGPNRRGGGGAGGFRFAAPTLAPLTYPAKPLAGPASLPVTATGYPVTVGAGATGSNSCTVNPGSNSVFSGTTTITSAGGGGAWTKTPSSGTPPEQGGPGGSGGGGYGAGVGGTGNTPPVSPAQGTNGGNGGPGAGCSGGGGGGAIVAGANQNTNSCGAAGGNGGGFPNAFGTSGENCGSFYYFAGGGGGGTDGTPSSNIGPGGLGGGGRGGYSNSAPAHEGTNGTANTGGGGGGGGQMPSSGPVANGGSGIVIIRYKFQ